MRAEGRKLKAVRKGEGANIKREQAWKELVPAAGMDNTIIGRMNSKGQNG